MTVGDLQTILSVIPPETEVMVYFSGRQYAVKVQDAVKVTVVGTGEVELELVVDD